MSSSRLTVILLFMIGCCGPLVGGINYKDLDSIYGGGGGDESVFVPQKEVIEETDFWVLELSSSADPREIALRHGHEFVGPVSASLPGVYLFKKHKDTVLGVTHPGHHTSEEILWNERQIAQQRQKRSLPLSDPLYFQQWHLHASSFDHTFVNILDAWQTLNVTGEGIVIAVVDDGLEYTHPDLAPNYVAGASYDFNYNDPFPFPDSSSDDHGTSAAGVAAARDNDVCGVGTAPRAGLAGIRLISKGSTDSQEAGALNYLWNLNDIYTNSWGPIDDGRRLEGPGRLAAAALQNGVEQGRNGKGSIFVWAGGNGRRLGDNCNYDGWANSRTTISVGAVDYTGTQAWYSESCAMLVVSAPSSGTTYSITTTDLKGSRGTSSSDCTSSFGGTSAAAPLAAGIVALILQANPNLGWRDVQGVLIQSAALTDASDSDWIQNGAGLWVNHKYGFGLIDAVNAVRIAQTWMNFGPVLSIATTVTNTEAIPEGDWLVIPLQVNAEFIVEHVELLFKASHRRRGDLRIVLVSPAGTESVLAEAHRDTNADYNWTFGSVRHWGEASSGSWSLKIRDDTSQYTGSMIGVTLTVYGH